MISMFGSTFFGTVGVFIGANDVEPIYLTIKQWPPMFDFTGTLKAICCALGVFI